MTEPNLFSTIFVHIPKSAGTTLRAIIEDVYPDDQICSIYHGNSMYLGMDDFKKLSLEKKRKFRIFCGHFEFGFHRQVSQPCKYITVMRDPVKRIISLYHHHLNEIRFQTDKNAAHLRSQLKSGKLSLAEFVICGISLQTDNCQTRFLSGDSPEFGQCTRAMLEKAKINLREHFSVVGLTERFDESVLLIQKALNWPPPYYVKQNISSERSGKEELDQATLEAIMRYNELDLELYNFAQDLLNEQIEIQGAEFKDELAKFNVANRHFLERYKKWELFHKIRAHLSTLLKILKLKLRPSYLNLLIISKT